jgi:hypothetical protein
MTMATNGAVTVRSSGSRRASRGVYATVIDSPPARRVAGARRPKLLDESSVLRNSPYATSIVGVRRGYGAANSAHRMGARNVGSRLCVQLGRASLAPSGR